ncbi:terpene synthase family protein [Streptomyces noursei]|uniref:terpene synthase family protein n=1 Tax=Streptomyces noursei TaxID=1971 RepID=UPI001679C337|nr:terpene synthase family protein [Streptomyces noursei]MCZ1014126.1 terpene synthase family protein [Streptomyces noursei]GGX24270.1 hypothetical protein GCM10010341_51870 [Streptomyces noursei]
MTADLLVPYHRHMADDRHRELAKALLTWSLQLCSCNRGSAWHAREAFYAATFERYCAPPDAAERENLLCAKYITFFFSLDDGLHNELEALADQLRSGRPVRAGELGTLHDALLADLRAHGLDTKQVEARIAELCAAAVTERARDARTMTQEQFHDLRMVTVAAKPYIDCRRAVRNLPVPNEENLVEQALEAIYIANDLASLDKETASGGAGEYETSNIVRFHAACSGRDLNAVITTVTDRYNHIAATLRNTTPGPLATILTSTVDGNLRAHVGLSTTRYPGAARLLRCLQPVVPPSRR